jgi:His-Xaa-Ser repeat protein HxsA
MKLKRFLIPSLVAAGLMPQQAAAVPTKDSIQEDTGKTSMFQTFKLQHIFTLAGHRSHSSHASHSSHRSSSGGGSVTRAPVYTPPPTPRYTAPAPTYSAPAPAQVYSPPTISTPLYTPPASDSTSPSTLLPGNSDKFLEIARQVQLGLYSWGYYSGEIDGIVGPATRLAISSMQADWGLNVTGTITPEVLDALKIVAE